MFSNRNYWCAFLAGGMAFLAGSIAKAEFASGSDASDGALDCAWLAKDDLFDCAASCFAVDPENPAVQPCEFIVDLSAAYSEPGTTWDIPGGDNDGDGFGDGVYDAKQWAVVYKFSTIDIPPNVIVKFKNHPSGAPVVWLAQGDVNIYGEINLNGENGFESQVWPAFAEPGPGGFPGGAPTDRTTQIGSLGFGPGGSNVLDNSPRSACYSGRTNDGGNNCLSGRRYGNDQIFPLIGGSGAGVRFASGEARPSVGGAGGGAILIATDTVMHLQQSSRLTAFGGTAVCITNDAAPVQRGGQGSGGAIRLLAGIQMTALGYISAAGGGWTSCAGYGGLGRIRLEAPTMEQPVPPNPVLGFTTSLVPGAVFPEDDAPRLTLVSVDSVGAPDDPSAGPMTTDVEIDTDQVAQVAIRATNIPAGTRVDVRVVPLLGDEIVVQSSMLAMQPDGSLHATATITFPPGRSEIQLRANWTP